MKTLLAILLFSPVALLAQVRANLTDFGATGNDPSHDDGPGIEAALNSGKGSPVIVVGNANTTYYTGRNIKITHSNVRWSCDSGTTVLTPMSTLATTQSGLLQASATPLYSASGESISIFKNSSSFVYPGAASSWVGKIASITGDSSHFLPTVGTNPAGGYRHNLYGKIIAVNGSLVTIDHPANWTYKGTSIVVYNTLGNIVIDGLSLDMKYRTGGFGFEFSNVANSTITRCFVDGTNTNTEGIWQGIKISGMNSLVEKCRVVNIAPKRKTAGTAYAISFSGRSITVQDCLISNCQNGIVSAARKVESTDGLVIHNTLISGEGQGHQIDFHGNSMGRACYNTLIGDTALNQGFTARYDNIRYDHNTIYWKKQLTGGNQQIFFVFEAARKDIYFDSNYVEVTGAAYSDNAWLAIAGTNRADTLVNFKMRGNVIIGTRLNASGNYGEGLEVSGNYFESTPTGNAGIQFSSGYYGGGYNFSNNTFVSDFGARSKYAISTPSVPVTNGLIQNNEFYTLNARKTPAQIRLNNTGNTLTNNTFHTFSANDFILNADGNNVTGNGRRLPATAPRPWSFAGAAASVTPRQHGSLTHEQ